MYIYVHTFTHIVKRCTGSSPTEKWHFQTTHRILSLSLPASVLLFPRESEDEKKNTESMFTAPLHCALKAVHTSHYKQKALLWNMTDTSFTLHGKPLATVNQNCIHHYLFSTPFLLFCQGCTPAWSLIWHSHCDVFSLHSHHRDVKKLWLVVSIKKAYYNQWYQFKRHLVMH